MVGKSKIKIENHLTMDEYYKETVPRKLYMVKKEGIGDVDVDITNILEYYKKCDSYENYEKTYFKLLKNACLTISTLKS